MYRVTLEMSTATDRLVLRRAYALTKRRASSLANSWLRAMTDAQLADKRCVTEKIFP